MEPCLLVEGLDHHGIVPMVAIEERIAESQFPIQALAV
jgi:hypothetical protein